MGAVAMVVSFVVLGSEPFVFVCLFAVSVFLLSWGTPTASMERERGGEEKLLHTDVVLVLKPMHKLKPISV